MPRAGVAADEALAKARKPKVKGAARSARDVNVDAVKTGLPTRKSMQEG
jgi:hypothetical protein